VRPSLLMPPFASDGPLAPTRHELPFASRPPALEDQTVDDLFVIAQRKERRSELGSAVMPIRSTARIGGRGGPSVLAAAAPRARARRGASARSEPSNEATGASRGACASYRTRGA